MAQILTKLEAILKDKYQPALTNQINTEPSPFLEKIRKVNLTNNTIRCAAPIGINGGFGFGAEGVALPASGGDTRVFSLRSTRWTCMLTCRSPIRPLRLHPATHPR